jgi:type IV secretion system protein VirB4
MERRAQFEEAGAHFESVYFLTFCWLPPADAADRAEGWLYEGRADKVGADGRAALRLRHAPIADCARYDTLRRAI